MLTDLCIDKKPTSDFLAMILFIFFFPAEKEGSSLAQMSDMCYATSQPLSVEKKVETFLVDTGLKTFDTSTITRRSRENGTP